MKIIDKRKSEWFVKLENVYCPNLIYPRTDVACSILENKTMGFKDTYCCEENCPLKLKRIKKGEIK